MRDVLSLILGGGRGTRLHPLTKTRSKPAVPVGGKYRLIDIPISNCINSGLTKCYVVTQFNSVSLHNHVSNTYQFDMFSQGFVEILAAQQTNETATWYQGTADAVRQNMRYIEREPVREVLVLSGDQIYRMNYARLIERHRFEKADVTIAVLPVPRSQVAGFGIMKLDPRGRVVNFIEKPQTDAAAEPFVTSPEFIAGQGLEPKGREFLASMGIYLFNRDVLRDILFTPPHYTDFGKEVFPHCINAGLHVQAHLFDGFWEDLGTIKSYHDCHMDLAGDNAPFRFHSDEGLIYTRRRNLPPSRVVGGSFNHVILSDGCVVNRGARVERAVIGIRSRVGRDVRMRNVVMIGADRHDSDEERAADERRGLPPVGVGDGCEIDNAILDKDCRIGRGAKILNRRGVADAEADNYVIRDGVVVIPRGAVVRDGEEV